MTRSAAQSGAQSAPNARRLRVAVVGLGWWSDVLADAARRSDAIDIVACYTRSDDKRRAFATKYGCRAVASYEEILADRDIEAIINTTPNNVHLETTRMAADAGKHVFLDKPIANTVAEGREISRLCEAAGVVLALGYQRRRRKPFPLDQGGDRCRPASAAWCRPNAISAATVSARSTCRRALPGGRNAGWRDAADRHPLCRRARNC